MVHLLESEWRCWRCSVRNSHTTGAGTLVGGMLGAFGGDKVGKLLGAKIQKGLDDNKPKVHVVQPKTV
ncbi:hypothetical protein AVR83_00005 [Lactiplantibacillus plantarum]|nr:hypothetical protein AVR83_00005 [Lactiplantibacillus plantarum]